MAYHKQHEAFSTRMAADRLVSSRASKLLTQLAGGQPVALETNLPHKYLPAISSLLQQPYGETKHQTQRDRMVYSFTSMVTHTRDKGVELTADDLVAGAVTACRAHQIRPSAQGPAQFLVDLANHWAGKSSVNLSVLRDPEMMLREAPTWQKRMGGPAPSARVEADVPLL